MTILIDPTSATPLYEQIVQQIQRQILSGTLPQGELLPGVRTLAADLSVSIITAGPMRNWNGTAISKPCPDGAVL